MIPQSEIKKGGQAPDRISPAWNLLLMGRVNPHTQKALSRRGFLGVWVKKGLIDSILKA